MRALLSLFAALALCGAATAQLASYTITGTPCTTGRLSAAGGAIAFQVEGVPRLGGSFTIVTEGRADFPFGRRLPFLITGASNTVAGALPLPFDIALLFPGEPFCGLLRTSNEIVSSLPPTVMARPLVRVPLSVPNVAAMAGTRFYQQVFSLELTTFGSPSRAGALSALGTGTIGF